jgi:hypothetical protein
MFTSSSQFETPYFTACCLAAPITLGAQLCRHFGLICGFAATGVKSKRADLQSER